MSKRARTSEPRPENLTDLQPESIFPGKDSQEQNDFVYAIYSKPRNETFSSRGGKPRRYTIDIQMSIPDEGDDCPLTLDSIANSKLPFMPDTPFIPNRPKHTKLTLPCKHSFSALTLLYSFCKNNMICPCCRAGEDVKADPNCLPLHLRAEFKAHIQRTLEAERRQDENTVLQDVVDSFSLFGVTIPYEILGVNGNLNLVANFYDMPQDTDLVSSIRPIFSYSCLMRPNRNAAGRISLTQNGQLRALNNLTQSGINSIQLCMQLSMQGTGNVLIDSTPLARLINPGESRLRMTIPGTSGSSVTNNNQFQVLVQLQNNDRNTPATSFVLEFARQGIENITWWPGTENLEIMSSNVQLSAILY